MMKNKYTNWGFTLIELLVTIVIIGILATISVATFGGYQEQAKVAKNQAECAQIRTCNATKAICIEAGKENCDALCDVTGFSCEATATDAACFTPTEGSFAGTITGYDNSCGGVDVIIPSNINGVPVTIIGSNAFRMKGLESVIIPDSVISIGNYAFLQNELTSIIIPDGVTSIGGIGFYSNRLTSFAIPASVVSIGSGALANNGPNKFSATITNFVPNTAQTWNLTGNTWVKQ